MKRLFIFCAIGTSLWFIYWIVTAHLYPELSNRGLFGDSFGAFSSLATALAFSGTAYAIFKQDQLSSEQEKQINHQAELQNRTALALERNSTIELVNILERMRSENAKEIAAMIGFIKQFSENPEAEKAISSANDSIKKLFNTQHLLNNAHHESLKALVSAWGMSSELADSIISTTGSGDYSGWAEMISDAVTNHKISPIIVESDT